MAAGMYVFGLHSSGHDYVTDELWAAFFKMLLEERLVPNIVLSNESPGFDWITKFVKAGKWCKWIRKSFSTGLKISVQVLNS